MNHSSRRATIVAFGAGVALTVFGAVLMGQGASQPVRSETQYFVTGEGDEAHLWVREGANLRCVGHGECAVHQHDHKDGHDHKDDGHDHAAEKPKK